MHLITEGGGCALNSGCCSVAIKTARCARLALTFKSPKLNALARADMWELVAAGADADSLLTEDPAIFVFRCVWLQVSAPSCECVGG